MKNTMGNLRLVSNSRLYKLASDGSRDEDVADAAGDQPCCHEPLRNEERGQRRLATTIPITTYRIPLKIL